jgi:hypothetical protein
MGGTTLTTVGVQGNYVPIYQPVKILAVSIIITSPPTTAPPIVEVYRRPICGADANRQLYCRFANPMADWSVRGNCLFYDDTQIILKPGEELIFLNVANGQVGGFGYRIVHPEPLWENPVNNSQMLRSTA